VGIQLNGRGGETGDSCPSRGKRGVGCSLGGVGVEGTEGRGAVLVKSGQINAENTAYRTYGRITHREGGFWERVFSYGVGIL